jgi:elongator complex protein 3
VGDQQDGAAQHSGLGKTLIHWAEEIAHQKNYQRVVVISAIGTRRYYKRLGYKRGELYMIKDLC